MIGVIAKEEDHDVVREFFELFKTPWSFYRPDVSCDVLLCCGADDREETIVASESNARLVVVYGSHITAADRERGAQLVDNQRESIVLSGNSGTFPIYHNCLTFSGAHELVEQTTQRAAAFETRGDVQIVGRVGYDLFAEIRFLLTKGQPVRHAQTPTIEHHIDLLRRLILGAAIPFEEIPPVPAGYRFIACLTHDVDHVGVRNHRGDHTMFGFLYRALIGTFFDVCRGRRPVRHLLLNGKAALSLPFVHLGLAKDFWVQFQQYLALEKREEVVSTFFVVPTKNDPGRATPTPTNGSAPPAKRATRYQASDIADDLRKLQANGSEIGLHGIDAWCDATKGREEFETVARITSARELGVRMHWLYFSEDSPATLEKAGFSYDSTLGYNNTVGYRSGTSQVFKPLQVERMLELPMHIMDTALFYPDYMGLSAKEAEPLFDTLIENATTFGGVLTINWHDRSIAPERLWDAPYLSFIRKLKKNGAWFATAADVVAWFRMRRAAVFGSGGVSVPGASERLPALEVRRTGRKQKAESRNEDDRGRRAGSKK